MENVIDSPTEETSVSDEAARVDAADIPDQPDSEANFDTEREDRDSVVRSTAVDDESSGGIEHTGDIPPSAMEDMKSPESDHKDGIEYDHTEEVPALLGKFNISDEDEAEIAPAQDTAIADAAPADSRTDDDIADRAAYAMKALHELHDNGFIPETVIEQVTPGAELYDGGRELKNIMQSLQESLAAIQTISVKMDAASGNTACLITRVDGLSSKYDALSEEMQSYASDGTTKSFLSKTFLAFSSTIIAMLVIFQCYTFISLLKTQRQQNTGVSSVLGNMSSLNRKMAGYDKNITKALLNPAQQEHALPHPASAEKTGHETAEAGSVHAAPVPEKINKLRNGLPEKRLIRKETGDWFFYNKKSEECIADSEVIEALNQAYKKIGRSVPTGFPMPAHNALCVLKPDGKGGTEIIMTKNYVP